MTRTGWGWNEIFAINPVFVRLEISSDPPTIYANVTSPNPIFPVKWVRAYHAVLDNGFVELAPPINFYEDPDGWIANLPDFWAFTNLKVVAYIAPGYWSEIILTPENVTNQLVRSGTVTIYGEFDWTGTDEWQTSALNFDTGGYQGSGWHNYATKYGPAWDITHWATAASSNMWWLYFTRPHAIATKEFEDVDPDHILARLAFAQVPAGLS